MHRADSPSWPGFREGLGAFSGWRFAIILVVLGGIAVTIDLPLAKFCLARNVPGEIREMLERGESFGHAYGVLAISLTVLFASPYGWPQAWRLLATSLAAGITADVIKGLIFRVRPCRMGPDIASVYDTFLGFMPWLRPTEPRLPLWESSYQSLPSAHTATAVALAFGLSALFPKGRTWFFALAFLTAANRVEGGAHFLSDTFWGAAVGWVIGCCSVRVLNSSVAASKVGQPLSTV